MIPIKSFNYLSWTEHWLAFTSTVKIWRCLQSEVKVNICIKPEFLRIGWCCTSGHQEYSKQYKKINLVEIKYLIVCLYTYMYIYIHVGCTVYVYYMYTMGGGKCSKCAFCCFCWLTNHWLPLGGADVSRRAGEAVSIRAYCFQLGQLYSPCSFFLLTNKQTPKRGKKKNLKLF